MVSSQPTHPRRDNDALVEDLLYLIDPTHPRLPVQDVARRLDYNRVDTLYRKLYRIGRSDLAAVLQQRAEAAA